LDVVTNAKQDFIFKANYNQSVNFLQLTSESLETSSKGSKKKKKKTNSKKINSAQRELDNLNSFMEGKIAMFKNDM